MQNLQEQKAAGDRRLFFSGVVFLGASNIIVKIIGLLFKIPMSYYLGDEGMGYFNAAYQIYTWLYMLSTAGLPVALSILISESRAKGDFHRVRQITRTAILTFFFLGIGGAGLMFFGATPLSYLIGSPNAAYCIAAIAPTLFFICISSALRGYFQGYQQMGPPAVSQILEALGKLLIGVLFATWAAGQGYGLPITAACAVAGLAVGEAAGMIYLIIARHRHEKKDIFPTNTQKSERAPLEKGLIRRLLGIALPITVSASVMSLSNLIDLVLIQRRLQTVGYSVAEATAFYGNYTTLVVPMFNLPPALIYPIATAVTPLLSATLARGGREAAMRIVRAVIRVTVLLALPCALGLSVFAHPILCLFFRRDMADSAAPYLSILALAVVFLSLLTVSNAILQSVGHAGKATISMLAGAVVKLLSNYILVGLPAVGALGVPVGTVLCYLTALACNCFFAFRALRSEFSLIQGMFRPLIASLLSVGAAQGLYILLGADAGNRPAVLFSIALAVLVYAAAVFLLGCITEDDLQFFPHGGKIAAFLGKSPKIHLFFWKK